MNKNEIFDAFDGRVSMAAIQNHKRVIILANGRPTMEVEPCVVGKWAKLLTPHKEQRHWELHILNRVDPSQPLGHNFVWGKLAELPRQWPRRVIGDSALVLMPAAELRLLTSIRLKHLGIRRTRHVSAGELAKLKSRENLMAYHGN